VSFLVFSVSKAALVATVLIERQAMASVRCFSAAILSVIIVLGIGGTTASPSRSPERFRMSDGFVIC
jgi:hypothetical protein